MQPEAQAEARARTMSLTRTRGPGPDSTFNLKSDGMQILKFTTQAEWPGILVTGCRSDLQEPETQARSESVALDSDACSLLG